MEGKVHELELEMYAPVKRFLEEQNYTVRSEVKNCDLVALRDDSLVIVELKTRFNLELLLQAVERQKITSEVYVAVPSPKKRDKRWRQIVELCRRLGLGILVVGRYSVSVVSGPCQGRSVLGKNKSQLLQEFRRRSGDFNIGGSSRQPVVTAYREESLKIAVHLSTKPGRVGDISRATGIARSGRILYDNHYGWFERIDRGVYAISSEGLAALERYASITAQIQIELPEFKSDGSEDN